MENAEFLNFPAQPQVKRIERELGTTFSARTPQQKRMKQLQEQVSLPSHVRKKLEFKKELTILSQYFDNQLLDQVFELCGYLTMPVMKKEKRLQYVLSLYNILLFIHHEEVIEEHALNELLYEMFYSSVDAKYSKTHRLIVNFYNSMYILSNKIIRECFFQRKNIFDPRSYIVQTFFKNLRDHIEIMMERSGFDMSARNWVRAPGNYSKLMILAHIRKDFNKLIFRLGTGGLKHVPEELTPKRLRQLYDQVREFYLHNYHKQFRTPYGLMFAILREFDRDFVNEIEKILIIDDVEKKRLSMRYSNITNVHGQFIKSVVTDFLEAIRSAEVVDVEDILAIPEKSEGGHTITTLHTLDLAEQIATMSAEEVADLFKDRPLPLVTEQDVFIMLCRELGINDDHLLNDNAQLTYLSVVQLEMLFKQKKRFTMKALSQMLEHTKVQFEKNNNAGFKYGYRLVEVVKYIIDHGITRSDITPFLIWLRRSLLFLFNEKCALSNKTNDSVWLSIALEVGIYLLRRDTETWDTG